MSNWVLWLSDLEYFWLLIFLFTSLYLDSTHKSETITSYSTVAIAKFEVPLQLRLLILLYTISKFHCFKYIFRYSNIHKL